MEGGISGEKSKGKENDETQKTDTLKHGKEDQRKLKEVKTKVNFIARNREAASQQGKMQRKARPPGASEITQGIPKQPKASKEANKSRIQEERASKVENGRHSTLPSTSDATNTLLSSTTSRLQTSATLTRRPHSSQAKKEKQPTSLQTSRPQTSRPPSTRPKLQIGRKQPRRLKDENETDLVTGMINKNLHHLLSEIFLRQSDATLAGCRRVSSTWWRYLRNVFWRDPVVRRQLEARLEQRWRLGLCTRVEVLVSGMSCKLRCAENFRPCKCLEKLNCAISGNAVIIDFGGTQYREVRKENNNENVRSAVESDRLPFSSASHTFPSEQFQVTLHLGLGLHLETSAWLSSPVFMGKPEDGASSLTVEARGWRLQPSPGKVGELIVKGEDGLVESRVPLPSPDGSVEKLQEAGGLVACLASGRVHVYNLERLARGGRKSALLFSSPELKEQELGVHFFHLTPSSLLMVTGTRLELVDFWKFSWKSATQEFVL